MVFRSIAGIVCACSVAAAAQNRAPSIDLVELDVVVTGRDGLPLADLTRDDFEVKDNGKLVEVKTFQPVSASGSREVDEGRSMVIVLDEVGLGPIATNAVKSIATYLLTKSGPGDEFSIVRFNNRSDEPYGDLTVALMRIGEYQAGRRPFEGVRSVEDMLKLVSSLSRRLEINGRRRKAIVCVGSPAICNIAQPVRISPGSIYKDWLDAMSASARANVSLYALMATRGWVSGAGLANATGGEVFGGSSDLRPFMDRIWRDLSRHYLLGYWPSGESKDLHSISVKVKRRGARVLTRRWRAN
jgi:hypothetical protein